ncbi:hypothetical protein DM558_06085 [Entomomonas moraniae]|uniref:Uncharacterized protein n=1 Tax=Entomomonas moraniae TaxID=2213226 RepID=A0A3S9XD90_9GAMM|nr:hypothetical protein [Entomomonas moraniae]AZS50370.1 hypothetical protein DM558_06085 [Entomomonas moraniae]
MCVALFKNSQEKGMSFNDSLNYAIEKANKLTGINSNKQESTKKTTLSKEQIEEQLERARQASPQVSRKGTTGNAISVDPSKMTEEEYDRFRESGGKFNFE